MEKYQKRIMALAWKGTRELGKILKNGTDKEKLAAGRESNHRAYGTPHQSVKVEQSGTIRQEHSVSADFFQAMARINEEKRRAREQLERKERPVIDVTPEAPGEGKEGGPAGA